MKSRIALLTVLAVALMGAAPAGAGVNMVLEAQPAVSTGSDICDIFYVCSMWHEEYPDWCTDWHVIYCGPALENVSEASVQGIHNEVEKRFLGRELLLDNRSGSRRVRIDHVAPQYHLASGAIVEPTGTWSSRDANGEEWREVRGIEASSLKVASWEDSSRDGVVGVGDRVIFADGTESTIKAVRLGIHVSVLSSDRRHQTERQ